MKIKVTQRDIPTLPDGTYTIGQSVYLRKRGDYANFFLRVQVDGKRRDVAIGSSRDFTLAVAKQTAERIRAQIKNGEYQWDKKEETVVPTLREFYMTALNAIASARHWKECSRKNRVSAIEHHVLPSLGDAPINEINRDDILTLLNAHWHQSPIKGKFIRGLLESIFSIAVVQGYRSDNPATWSNNLALFLPPPMKLHQTQHYKAVSFQDAATVLKECLLRDGFGTYRAIIFAILTARRINEICNVKWSDIDLDEAVWTVPDEHMKVHKGHPRRVPLSTEFVGLLRKWKDAPQGEYICIADGQLYNRSKDKPLGKSTPMSTLKRILQRHKLNDATIHGFRSTFTDWAAERLERVELVELSLDHSSGNAVRQAYFRSDLLDQRRGLMQRYSDALFNEVKRQIEGDCGLWRPDAATEGNKKKG